MSDPAPTAVGEIVVTAPPMQVVGPQQASFRGVPFGVTSDAPKFGRRLAVHEYPFRELAWAEDLGKKTRRFAITGFLISNSAVYGGGSVFDQLSAMIVAAETKGPGTLVHPYLGTMQVACESFEPASGLDLKGYLSFTASFVEGGQARFPSNRQSTGTGVGGSAKLAASAVGADFSKAITPLLPLGGVALSAAIASVGSWTAKIGALGASATSLINLACGMTGSFGRYSNGALAGLAGAVAQAFPVGTTIDQLIAAQASSIGKIATACLSVANMAESLGLPGAEPTDLGAAAVGAIAALRMAIANPADGLSQLQQLAAFSCGATDPVSVAVDTLHQRLAVAALAQVAQAYQPSSYDDAAAVRSTVSQLIGRQVLAAGDAGDDDSFQALILLRASVVRDLNTRGASLAAVATVNLPQHVPAPVIAQRLYLDGSRAAELVAEADPPNPLFMPRQFRALVR